MLLGAQPVPETSDRAALEALYRRYWFPLRERCRRLLPTASAADEVARLSLARLVRLQGVPAPGAEWMESLYGQSTSLCLERLTGKKRRDAEWLKTLALQKAGQSAHDEIIEQPPDLRYRLVDLLERIEPDARPAVVYRYLDELTLDTIARLTGAERGWIAKNLARFHARANEFLAGRDEPAIEEPAARECPDRLEMDRLLAGEKTGLEQAEAHLAGHAACLEDHKAREERQSGILTAEAVEAGCEGLLLAIERVAKKPAEPLLKRLAGARAIVMSGIIAVVVGLVLLAGLETPPEPAQNPIIKQGGYSLELLIQDEGGLRVLGPDETLEAGTSLQFRLGAHRPVMAALASLRETGKSGFIGLERLKTWPVPTGGATEPPFEHQLGSSPGYERLFALFCPLPAPLQYLPNMLEYAYRPGPDGRRNLARGFIGAPEHCHLRSVLVRLVPGPAKSQQDENN